MKTLLAVLVFLASVAQAETPAAKVTVDAVKVGTFKSGEHYCLARFHLQEDPEKVFEMICAVKNADCRALAVGAHYNLVMLEVGDPDGYVGYPSVRVFGDDEAAVYYNPLGRR
jgi:hypothetical protein